MNREGAIAGMVSGMVFTFVYIAYFKLWAPEMNNAAHWWFGISPEGIGSIGAVLNISVAMAVAHLTAPPPAEIQNLVEDIRIPTGAHAPQSLH